MIDITKNGQFIEAMCLNDLANLEAGIYYTEDPQGILSLPNSYEKWQVIHIKVGKASEFVGQIAIPSGDLFKAVICYRSGCDTMWGPWSVFLSDPCQNPQHVMGVKGESELLYRNGYVNITKRCIGLGNVENTKTAFSYVDGVLYINSNPEEKNEDIIGEI